MSSNRETIEDHGEHDRDPSSSRSPSKERGADLDDDDGDDEELAKTLVHGQGVDIERMAPRFYRMRQRRTQDAVQIEKRLAAAEERRNILLEEKKSQLRAIERQRVVKIQKTRSMRRVATEKFVKEALAPLKYMRSAGLRHATTDDGPNSTTPDEIEMILVNDPRSCIDCANAANGDISKHVCPITQRPHRRSLVTAAEIFLKLVGGTCVNLIPNRIDAVGSSVPASCQAKAKRGISVNPQLFALSYYNAALPIGEVDPLLKECSISLVQITDELLRALEGIADHSEGRNSNDVDGDDYDSGVAFDEAAMKLLLVSFAKAWRQYAKLSDQSISFSERAHAQQELLTATAVALTNTYKKMQLLMEGNLQSSLGTLDPLREEVQLAAMVAILRNRMLQIGGHDALATFDQHQKLEEERARLSSTAAGEATPQIQYIEDFPSDDPGQSTSFSNCLGSSRTKVKHPHNLLVVSPVGLPSGKGFPSEPPSPIYPDGTNSASTHPEIKDEVDKHLPKTAYEFAANESSSFQEYIGTSGSDTDVDLRRRDGKAIPPTTGIVYGPALPPLWRIDPLTGKSEPPPQEVIRQEKFKQLEFRARKAYAAKMDIQGSFPTHEDADAEKTKTSMVKLHQDSFWEQFHTDLNRSTADGGPDLRLVPMLLNSVSESLIEALPRRLRQKIGQEIRDVLDWDLLRRGLQSTEGRMRNVLSLLAYVTNRVGQLGASASEEALHEGAQNLAKQLKVSVGAETASSTTPFSSLGAVVVSIFKFMFDSIHKLQKDIADYSLLMISKELAANATAYEQEFIQECIEGRSPSEWVTSACFMKEGIKKSKTIEILAKGPAAGVSTEPSEAQPTPELLTLQAMLPPSVLFLQDSDRSLFAGMMQGVLDLLRSSGRDSDTRWVTYPKEILYFARHLIFEAANTIQLSTLRLLLTGTLTMIFTPLQIDHAAVQQFLTQLDSKMLVWLKGDNTPTSPDAAPDSAAASGKTVDVGDESETILTLGEIKDAIKDEIIVFLAECPKRRQPPPQPSVSSSVSPTPLPPLELSDNDFMVLRGVIDKMIDTTSPQYILFERRIMRAVTAGCLVRVASAGSGLSQDGGAVAKASKSFEEAHQAAISNALHVVGKLVSPALNDVSATISSVILQNWEVCKAYYRAMELDEVDAIENSPNKQE